ncbi:MAG: hypothetical protein EP330_04365 [Deltaproteobacteria bacterium]|nr:MAG: hypothetical protein EP330_04365 [Deltaproteobacteria bacterium]
MFPLFLAAALAQPVPVDTDRPLPSPLPELARPDQLSLGMGFAPSTDDGHANLSLRYQLRPRIPIALELGIGASWDRSAEGELERHLEYRAALSFRPVLLRSRHVWAAVDLTFGVRTRDDWHGVYESWLRAGVVIGFRPQWAPALTVGLTQNRGGNLTPSIGLSWGLDRRKRRLKGVEPKSDARPLGR